MLPTRRKMALETRLIHTNETQLSSLETYTKRAPNSPQNRARQLLQPVLIQFDSKKVKHLCAVLGSDFVRVFSLAHSVLLVAF